MGGCDGSCGVTEADVMLRLLLAAGMDANRVDVDRQALNTIENAINVIPHIQQNAPSRVLLVTSDFHIPRAFLVFASVFRHVGLDVSILEAAGAPSGLEEGGKRQRRPKEISDWRYSERIQHEQSLMDVNARHPAGGMKGWIESYRAPDLHGRPLRVRVNERDFQLAMFQLRVCATASALIERKKDPGMAGA